MGDATLKAMPVRESIVSVRHPLLKEIRRALEKGDPTPEGCTVIEGRHLLEEALRGPAVVETILAPAEWDLPAHRARRIDVPETVLRQVASTESSPGVMALVRWRAWTLAELLAPPALVVILDGVQDPGNAGTIVRSAEAFGATGVVFRRGSVSPRNPKLLRAAAGSSFRLPTVAGDPELPVKLYAAHPHEGANAADVNWSEPCALAVGSEAHGVSAELLRQATPVRIPTGRVESLNAAVAASILLYEASQCRRAQRT